MAIAHVASSNSGVLTDSGAGTNVAINDFDSGSGSQRILHVTIATRNGSVDSIDELSWGGTSLLSNHIAATNNSAYYLDTYYLLNPATGVNDLEVSWSGNVDAYFVSATFLEGVDQGAPEASNVSTGTSLAASVNLTTLTDGAWILDAVNTDFLLTSNTVSTNSGQTQRSNSTAAVGQILTATGSEEFATAGAQTAAWTITVSSNRNWCMTAVSYKPYSTASFMPIAWLTA